MERVDIRRAASVGGASFVGLLLLVVVGLYVFQQGRTLPNTRVAGVDVGRMTGDEVRAELGPLVDARRDEPIELTFEDQRFPIVPTEVGYAIDLDATVAAAMERGRTGLPGEVVTRLRSLRVTASLPVRDTYDEVAVDAWVAEVADAVDRDTSPGVVTADPQTLEVSVELPYGSAEVRRDDTRALVEQLLTTSDPGPAELPVDTEPQTVPDEDVEQIAVQVERAIAEEVVLTAPSGDTDADGDEPASLTFTPADLASIIEVVEVPGDDGATLELTVSADAVEEVIGDVGDRFSTEPVDARFVSSRTPPATLDAQGSTSFSPVAADVEVDPGRDGTSFELDLVVEQLTDLLRAGERTAELALATTEPELTTEEAEELRPTHLLGTFTTYHPSGQPRVVNIQKLADTIDNTVLLPDEQFSINGISGRRTCAAGYQPAGAIIAGELEDVCGGGTSQFATTTLNAAFFSGLQLDQWKAHSWYFTRYPRGREATLNFPDLDVKFTNTSDGAVIVRTTHTPGSITVSIYGQPVADEVSAEHGGTFAPKPFREEIRETDERCEGEREVIQDGAGGFSVNVVREIDPVDGATDRQDIRTVYVPRTEIIEEGTRDCSPPEEEEEEEAEEEEEPDAEEPDAEEPAAEDDEPADPDAPADA